MRPGKGMPGPEKVPLSLDESLDPMRNRTMNKYSKLSLSFLSVLNAVSRVRG